MKDSKLPDSGASPERVVAASSSVHNPDGIETTNVAKPLPPVLPAVIVAMTKAERESTKIVKPLPRPAVATPRGRGIDRRWLLGTGIGVMALAAATLVVMNGVGEVERRDERPGVKADGPGEPARPRRIEIKPSEPPPAPAKRDEPSVQPRRAASEPAASEPDVVSTDPPASESPALPTSSGRTSSILRHRPTETKPATSSTSRSTKPTPRRKPRPAEPKWNPDALFLKKK